MPRKRKNKEKAQLSFDFDAIIKKGKTLSREEVEAEASDKFGQEYNPVERTADYMKRSLEVEKAWETTLRKARELLLAAEPVEIYWQFILDLKRRIEKGGVKSSQFSALLEHITYRGLGMSPFKHLKIKKPQEGGTRWRVDLIDPNAIQDHLKGNIIGDFFLNEIAVDDNYWSSQIPLIGASDVSQHRSAVPVPSRFFKRSVPFLLNNAAGAIFKFENDKPSYEPLFDPRPNEQLLRWMLIDPSYQDELDPEDFKRCIASSMDVGHYKFDFEKLLSADKRSPDLVFRDGSLFPQDAYLDNYIIDNRRGEFTRAAIDKLVDCIKKAHGRKSIYCGVVKNIQLKVYSAVIDWFISTKIDKNWDFGAYTLNDGHAISFLLSSPEFIESSLTKVISTCLIKRSFTTRASLNMKANLDELDRYFEEFEARHKSMEIKIDDYKNLCNLGHTYMFFLGHSKSPQQQLPRYEFFYQEELGTIQEVTKKILASLKYCGLSTDKDHSFMSEEPMQYLLPSISYHAHRLSKDVGKHIDRETGQWIMARYKSMIDKN